MAITDKDYAGAFSSVPATRQPGDAIKGRQSSGDNAHFSVVAHQVDMAGRQGVGLGFHRTGKRRRLGVFGPENRARDGPDASGCRSKHSFGPGAKSTYQKPGRRFVGRGILRRFHDATKASLD